jgi:hypothetical protein
LSALRDWQLHLQLQQLAIPQEAVSALLRQQLLSAKLQHDSLQLADLYSRSAQPLYVSAHFFGQYCQSRQPHC